MHNFPRWLVSIALSATPYSYAAADSTLEYLVNDTPNHAGNVQPVHIKDGKVLVKNAGGDTNMDLLFNREDETLRIIDHRKRSYMTLDSRQIEQLGQQAETVQPLLQGFGEQLGKLSPQEKARWQQMLGDSVSIDDIAAAAGTAKSANIVKTGLHKDIAGINCEQMNVLQGSSKTAEFCLADPVGLKLSSDDYKTVRTLLSFSESAVSRTQGLANQFGIKIPNVRIHDLAGVPVEMKDLSGRAQSSIRLNRINTSPIDPGLIRLPSGYHQEPLKLWK